MPKAAKLLGELKGALWRETFGGVDGSPMARTRGLCTCTEMLLPAPGEPLPGTRGSLLPPLPPLRSWPLYSYRPRTAPPPGAFPRSNPPPPPSVLLRQTPKSSPRRPSLYGTLCRTNVVRQVARLSGGDRGVHAARQGGFVADQTRRKGFRRAIKTCAQGWNQVCAVLIVAGASIASWAPCFTIVRCHDMCVEVGGE